MYFEKRSFCGINDDNIYTFWDGGDPRDGTTNGRPILGSEPQGRLDSLLVHDGEGIGGDTKGGRGCFLADTPVWVNGELVQISKVAPGQTVGKLHCTTPAPCLEQVEKLDVHEGTFECRDITLENGNRISVADLHFFLLDSGQWVPVQELKSSSKLVSLEGPIAIKSIVKRAVPFAGKVYNLKVKNGQQY
ncbi:MAG: Hint domain-containing protein, partial [Planctomycetota bacterium]